MGMEESVKRMRSSGIIKNPTR